MDGECDAVWQSLFVAIVNAHTALAQAPQVHTTAVELLGARARARARVRARVRLQQVV